MKTIAQYRKIQVCLGRVIFIGGYGYSPFAHGMRRKSQQNGVPATPRTEARGRAATSQALGSVLVVGVAGDVVLVLGDGVLVLKVLGAAPLASFRVDAATRAESGAHTSL
jgi:hypothetical protein